MKITVWEKKIINDVLGASRTAHVSEMETVFELRKKTRLTDKQIELYKNQQDKAKTTHTDVSFTDREVICIYEKLNNPRMTVPIDRASIDLREKLTAKKKEISYEAGRS